LGCGPIQGGYKIDVTEFDFKGDGGVCYDEGGVKVTHWRRSHAMSSAAICACPNSRSLATFDNYLLPRKNDSYQLVIWNRQLWGNDCWCPRFKGDGSSAEKAGGHQDEKRRYALENKTIPKPLKVYNIADSKPPLQPI
jgi:hypothetical protein